MPLFLYEGSLKNTLIVSSIINHLIKKVYFTVVKILLVKEKTKFVMKNTVMLELIILLSKLNLLNSFNLISYKYSQQRYFFNIKLSVIILNIITVSHQF